jgi:hypothetical protein
MLYGRPKVFKFSNGKPRVFKIKMGRLKRQPFSNGSNIGIPYTNMNTMVDGGGLNLVIAYQEGNLLTMVAILEYLLLI